MTTRVVLEVAEELADPSSPTGLSTEGLDYLRCALEEFGLVVTIERAAEPRLWHDCRVRATGTHTHVAVYDSRVIVVGCEHGRAPHETPRSPSHGIKLAKHPDQWCPQCAAAPSPLVVPPPSPAKVVNVQSHPNWREHRACRNIPVRTFHEDAWDVHREVRLEGFATARAICLTCPVQRECAAFAATLPEVQGVYGGMDPHELQRGSVNYPLNVGTNGTLS